MSANWVSNKFSIPLPEGDEPVLGKPAAPVEPPPAVPGQALQRATHRGTPPAAGPSAALPSVADALADQLAGAARPGVDDLIEGVRAMVDAAEDLSSLQTALLDAYGDLDTGELTRVMAAAFALAELKGMDAVTAENDRSLHTARHATEPARPQEIHIHLAEGMVKVENAVQVPAQALPEVVVHNNLTLPDNTPIVQNTIHVPPGQPPEVHITNDVQPAAVSVSLPPRKVETVVMRDDKGQIASATQIETDLP